MYVSMRSIVVLALSFSWTLTCFVFSAVAEPNTDDEKSTSFEARVLTITDVVLEQHIDPPTRQQMILTGIKALYRADKQPTPNGLSGDISEMATRDQIANHLRDVHARFSELDDMEAILTNGMLEAVPGQAVIIDANVGKVQGQLAANRYVGTGIALGKSSKEAFPEITKVFYNGPAWKAGVLAHDLIVEIDGENTESEKLNHIVEQLRGDEGSDVIVVVRQPDATELRKLTITRGRVFIPTVQGHRQISEGEWEYTIDSANDIALIRISSIGPSTLHELRQVETKLRGKNIRGIVLDLRSGGGLLHDLVMVADSLLDGGVIGHVRSLDEVKTYEARPGVLFQDVPMAVLIAEHAGTDRVFLTAALQDRGRAVVIGERTSGETYVNSFVPIPGRDEKIRLAVAVAQRGDGTPLLTEPSRRPLLRRVEVAEKRPGKKRLPSYILPDFVVPAKNQSDLTPNQVESVADPMLAKAIEVLSNTEARVQASPRQESISG